MSEQQSGAPYVVAEMTEQAVAAIERQQWIDRISQRLEEALREGGRLAGNSAERIKSFLNGTWLGHPLHPVLTDIPIGAWTASLLLDVFDAVSSEDDNGYAKAADATLKIGIVGAVGAALAGLADWQHLQNPERRVGTAHGLMNSAALAAYLASLRFRKRSARGTGRLLSLLGYSLVFGSSILGGHMVYRQRIGTDHSDPLPDSRQFEAVLPESELRDEEPREVQASNTPLVLIRHRGRIHALAAHCSHLAGPLKDGTIEGDGIVCPWHGSCFSLETGWPLRGPATAPQAVFEVRVRDGMIEVRPPQRPEEEAIEPSHRQSIRTI